MRRTFGAAFAAALLAALAPQARGWGDVGHEITNGIAAETLPKDAPAWLRSAGARLTHLGPEPDRWRLHDLKALDRSQAPDHYIDVEHAGDPLSLPEDRYAFLRSLVAREREGKLPVAPDRVGFAPYRAIELAEQLEAQVAARERCEPGSEAARAAEDACVTTAGILGHYVADLANPHHTTMHHDGWVGENPKGFRTAKGFHSEFEEKFLERAVDRAAVKKLVPEPRVLDDARKAVLEHTKRSHDRVEELYQLEKDGAFARGAEETEAGKRGIAFLHERLASGATLLRNLWVTATKRGAARSAHHAAALKAQRELEARGHRRARVYVLGAKTFVLSGEVKDEAAKKEAEEIARAALGEGANIVSRLLVPREPASRPAEPESPVPAGPK